MTRVASRSLVLVAGLLVGCAGAPRVVDLPTGAIYRDQELGGGELPVVVLGEPFAGLAPAALAGLVVAAMPQGTMQNTRFVAMAPSAGPAAPTARRVVWAFGRALAGGDGSAVCQSTGAGGPQGGHIRVYAAVCRGPSALSAVQGDVEGVTAPTDARFRGLIHYATLELFAPHPDQRDESGFLRPFGGFLR